MDNKLVLKSLLKVFGNESFCPIFSRYVFILNNYLKHRKISVIENKPHQHNKLLETNFLTNLAKEFEVQIDLESPLFEDRLKIDKKPFPSHCSWVSERFFKRLTYFKENNLLINQEVIKDMVKMGTSIFYKQYNLKEQI